MLLRVCAVLDGMGLNPGQLYWIVFLHKSSACAESLRTGDSYCRIVDLRMDTLLVALCSKWDARLKAWFCSSLKSTSHHAEILVGVCFAYWLLLLGVCFGSSKCSTCCFLSLEIRVFSQSMHASARTSPIVSSGYWETWRLRLSYHLSDVYLLSHNTSVRYSSPIQALLRLPEE